jgi:2-(1,2-epoxy-1,2-dihydrophenyl)acetyl-CoA isomerase
MAAQLAAGPTRGYARTKQAIYGAGLLDLEQALDRERDMQRELGQSEDYREGVAAFMDKRTPKFTGR